MAVDPKRENERKLQPDPLLREGRISRAWVWTIGLLVLAVILVTFFAVGSPNGQQAGTQPGQHASLFTTGAGDKPPDTALPAGRQSGTAAKENSIHTVR